MKRWDVNKTRLFRRNSRKRKFSFDLENWKKDEKIKKEILFILFFHLNLNYEKNSSKENTRNEFKNLQNPRKVEVKTEEKSKIKNSVGFYEGSSKSDDFESFLCSNWVLLATFKLKAFLIKAFKAPSKSFKLIVSDFPGRSLYVVIKFMRNCWRFLSSFFNGFPLF